MVIKWQHETLERLQWRETEKNQRSECGSHFPLTRFKAKLPCVEFKFTPSFSVLFFSSSLGWLFLLINWKTMFDETRWCPDLWVSEDQLCLSGPRKVWKWVWMSSEGQWSEFALQNDTSIWYYTPYPPHFQLLSCDHANNKAIMLDVCQALL